jgi:hypothetical protein
MHLHSLLSSSLRYTQSLLKMGDDEFFSSASRTNAPRNRLTLDELTSSSSRKLLNIAFTL